MTTPEYTEMRNLRDDEVLTTGEQIETSHDRIMEGVSGNLYTGHSTGWYDQMTPMQRVTAYMMAYVAAKQYIVNGEGQQMEDEIIFLLAVGQEDDEAWQEAWDYGYEAAEGGNPSILDAIEMVYFTGAEGQNPYVDGVDIDLPKFGHAEYKTEMMNRIQGVATGEDWYEPNMSFMPWQADPVGFNLPILEQGVTGTGLGWNYYSLGDLAKPLAGLIPGTQPIEVDPTAGDLFAKVSAENKGPSSNIGRMEHFNANWGPRIYNVVFNLAAGAGVMKAAGMWGNNLQKIAATSSSLAEAQQAANLGMNIAGNLNQTAQILHKTLGARRVVAGVGGAYSVASYGQGIADSMTMDPEGFFTPIDQYETDLQEGNTTQNDFMDTLVEIARANRQQQQTDINAAPRDRAQLEENRNIF